MPVGVPHTIGRPHPHTHAMRVSHHPPVANTGGCHRRLPARDYGDLLFRITDALVAVGGLSQGSGNVNWRRFLVVTPNLQEWAEARGVGREDHEFGMAPRSVLLHLPQPVEASPPAVGMAGR
jgi:hypothetical protein